MDGKTTDWPAGGLADYGRRHRSIIGARCTQGCLWQGQRWPVASLPHAQVAQSGAAHWTCLESDASGREQGEVWELHDIKVNLTQKTGG
jgi:hypothetical protein